jgi:MFS family permease
VGETLNPAAAHHWRGPRWALALLLAGLGMLGPFAIDTYLPAFTGIAASLSATPLQMQQTLSAYLFGFAAMNLFHGSLADAMAAGRWCWQASRSSRWRRSAVRCPPPSARWSASVRCRGWPRVRAWWCRASSCATCSRRWRRSVCCRR